MENDRLKIMINSDLHTKPEDAVSIDHDYVVIFGSALLPGGKPSGTMKRRVQGAVNMAAGISNAKFLVTGGKERFGLSEAKAMRNLLLEKGVPVHDIVMEQRARDTLDSVYFCRDILCSLTDIGRIFVCSSPYHLLRCLVLFRMIGIKVATGKMPSDRPALGWIKWIYFCLREAAALPWDMMVVLYLRIFNKQRAPGD
jgi:vancomycin permeability regulator SanA